MNITFSLKKDSLGRIPKRELCLHLQPRVGPRPSSNTWSRELILPDVNVLVCAHREDVADHTAYHTWLEGVINGE